MLAVTRTDSVTEGGCCKLSGPCCKTIEMCVCDGGGTWGESLKAEPWQLRGKHVWGMFVLHLAPERSCVHCPFPRTPEHSRHPRRSPSVQPLISKHRLGGGFTHLFFIFIFKDKLKILPKSMHYFLKKLRLLGQLHGQSTLSGSSRHLFSLYLPLNVVQVKELEKAEAASRCTTRYQVCFSRWWNALVMLWA